jgi:hypothetical protein
MMEIIEEKITAHEMGMCDGFLSLGLSVYRVFIRIVKNSERIGIMFVCVCVRVAP